MRNCRFTTYRHRFARAAPAPRAKRNDSKNRKIRRIVDAHRPSTCVSTWLGELSLHNRVARALRGRARRPSQFEPRAQRYTGLATDGSAITDVAWPCSNQSPSRAPRAACVSTWLGEAWPALPDCAAPLYVSLRNYSDQSPSRAPKAKRPRNIF